jgi:hypothetical protein
MNDSYISEKLKDILEHFRTGASLDVSKKIVKLILEATYLAGKIEGVQEAREVLR